MLNLASTSTQKTGSYNLNLSMYDDVLFNRYKSNSQRARVLSERWFSSNLYCPCCLSPTLSSYPNNQKVSDFYCAKCKNPFQAKCSSKEFKSRVVDGEYHTMMSFINSKKTPNFLLLNYSSDDWFVKNLMLIPRFFVTESMIERRKPLNSTAKRAGWTGCNILINQISNRFKIPIIKNEKIIDPAKIISIWKEICFVNAFSPSRRSWVSDVLKCVDELGKDEFTLAEIYKYSGYLKELHPKNNYIKDKIRQQLQVLRDNKVLIFKSPGVYQLLHRGI